MGAPVGNNNAGKAKLWAAAIERAVARLGGAPPPGGDRSEFVKGIDQLADEFVALRARTDPLPFFREYGDRQDGKPHQSIDATVAADVTVNIKRFTPPPDGRPPE